MPCLWSWVVTDTRLVSFLPVHEEKERIQSPNLPVALVHSSTGGLCCSSWIAPEVNVVFRCLEVVSDCPAPHLFAATYRPCRPWLPGLPGLPGCTSASQLCCRYAASNWTDRTAPYPPAEQKSIGEASMSRLPMRWKPETNGAVFS